MKKILLINRGTDTDNFGDRAINFTLQKLLEKEGYYVDSVNYTQVFSGKGIINSLKQVISIIRTARKNYDVALIGGGQLIQDNKTFPLSFLLWTFFLHTFSTARIVLYSVGIDEKFGSRALSLFRRGMRYVDRICVRDYNSQANLRMLFNRDSEVAPDCVFAISRIAQVQPKNEYNTLFGISTYRTISRYKHLDITEDEYLTQQAEIISPYLPHVKLIYNTDSDLKYARKFKDFIKDQQGIELELIDIPNLDAYVNTIASSKSVISSRMHALIIAKSFGKEIHPVERNRKLQTFIAEHHRENDMEVYYHMISQSLKRTVQD